jgi:hypothetical protein
LGFHIIFVYVLIYIYGSHTLRKSQDHQWILLLTKDETCYHLRRVWRYQRGNQNIIQVKLWCWASSRRKTIVNRNKVIESFLKFLFLPSPFGCMLFVLNSVFHWVFLIRMMNYSHWFLCLIRFHVQNTSSGLWSFVEDCLTLSEVLYFAVLLVCCYEQWVFTKKYLSSLVFL